MSRHSGPAGLSVLIAAAAIATSFAAPLFAQEFQQNISCVSGFVDARDYAELSQDFREFSTDRRATLILRSEDEELTLKVLRLDGESVCENVADLRTRCTWQLQPEDVFNVQVDNTTRDTETAYELCAN
jgi:hypothetical protein